MTEHPSHDVGRAASSDGYRVRVTGAGVAGLSVARVLDARGHTVDVVPATGGVDTMGVVAVAMTPNLAAFLDEYDVVEAASVATSASETRYLARDGTTETTFPVDRRFTAVEPLIAHLERTRPRERSGADTPSSHVDLHVAADGWLSPVRQRLLPAVTPQYAGYVTWHGTIAEDSLPPEDATGFVDRLTLSRGPNDLLAAMVLPGTDGGTDPGERRLHWQWYRPVAARDLGTVLTDRHGRNHEGAVEPGDLQPRFTATLHEHAIDHAPALTRLVRSTANPGVEPVVDLTVPDAVVDDTVLVGDAAYATRQHTGASTTKAVEDASALGTALDRYGDLDAALADWRETQELAGRQLVEQGRQTDLDRLVGEV